jgi:hypothetical protein
MDSDSAALDLFDDLLVEQSSEEAISKPETPEKPGGILSILLGVLFQPRRTFEAIREGQRSYWWVVVVLMIVMALLAAYSSATTQFSGFQGPAGQVNVPAGGQGSFQPPGGSSMLLLSAGLPFISSVASSVLNYLFTAIVIYGFSLILGGKANFKSVFAVTVWSTLPLVVRDLVHSIASLVASSPAQAGLSAMLSPGETASMPLLNTLAGHIDIYLIWSLILLGIAVAVTTRLSKGKSLIILPGYLVLSAGVLVAAFYAGQAISNLVGVRGPGFGGPPG